MNGINNKFLTIAIPTYNRSHYLKQCLDVLCAQINDEVEIVVRDNHSVNYNFDQFIKPYVDKYGVIACKNKVNIGGDASVARIFEECRSKWLLILGDDDYLQPNAINKILCELKKHPDAIFYKFNSKYEGYTSGITGFAEAMKEKNAFNESFFSSEGFHNMELTSGEMFNHYRRLSFRFPHLLRVIDHLISNPKDKCYFSREMILQEHGVEISWNHKELIIPFLTMFDVYRDQRGIFKSNINRCIVGTVLRYISSSDLCFTDKFYFYKLVITKYGVYNSIRYNTKSFLYIILSHFKLKDNQN